MGGTRDGEIYEIESAKRKAEVEASTTQKLVPLSSEEVELAKQIGPEARAKMFQEKAETNKDLENEMREWLRKKGKI